MLKISRRDVVLGAAGALVCSATAGAADRPVVMGVRGMVASHHPVASLAAMEILKKGGTAVDAAIAANAALELYPHMCGIGGDLFMLIYSAKDKKVYALNASGRSPYAMTRDYFKQKGVDKIPLQGSLLPVSVPGVVDGWDQALKRFGQMTLGEVLHRPSRLRKTASRSRKTWRVGPADRMTFCSRRRPPRRS